MLTSKSIISTCLGLFLTAVSLSGGALAEPSEPVDKNTSGPTLGVNMAFGQATASGGKGPGIIWFMGVEPGYGAARDTWNRVEPSFEIGAGYAEFKVKDDEFTGTSKAPIKLFALAKVGYGYSVGQHSFAIWRLGVGPALMDFKQSVNGVNRKASDTVSGFMARAGMDFMMPVAEGFDFLMGGHYNYLTFSVDELEGGYPLDRSFQVNGLLLQISGRLRF